MNLPMKAIPVSQQIEQLRSQLLDAYIKKENAEGAVKAASEQITAIRNVLAGLPLGEALAKEKQEQ